MMDKQEGFYSVDEQVISPLHSSLIQPKDSVNQTASNSSSSSSRRRKDAQIKAAIAILQAKPLKERIKRENEAREKEFREEMAQRELELKLEYRKRELDLLRKKRENDMAIISAQDQADVAQLENEILGQDLIEGKEVIERRVKVSQLKLRHL